MLFDALVALPSDVRDAPPIGDEPDPFVIDHVRALLAADGRTGVLDTLGPRVDPPPPAEYSSLAGGTMIVASPHGRWLSVTNRRGLLQMYDAAVAHVCHSRNLAGRSR